MSGRPTVQERAGLRREMPFRYLVFRRDGYAWAKNGTTDEVEYWDSDTTAVIQWAINATYDNPPYRGVVIVKGVDRSDVGTLSMLPGVLVFFDDQLSPARNILENAKLLNVPTNGGWYSSNAGSGSVTQIPSCLSVSTGTTASSRGLAYCPVLGLAHTGFYIFAVNFGRRLELSFFTSRENSDSEAVARFQLKRTYSGGALTSEGLGIEVQNFNLLGEAYGTSRGTVSLGTLTNNGLAHVRIVLVPGDASTRRVQFYLNGELEGELTGNYVPYSAAAPTHYLVSSIINGTTGGVDAMFKVGSIWIAQEW